MVMKKRVFVLASPAIALACLVMLATPATAQGNPNSPSSNAKWVGVWQGQLEGFPGIVLTLGDDLGELNGTVVFTAIQDGAVAGHVTHNILHPHLDGNRLSFQVKRPGGGEEIVDMDFDLTSDSKGQLVCPKCGAASPTAMEKIP
jgi:hypothetical protein